MANTIKTVMTYPLNGSTVDFNIPFEYLARKFVTITLIGTDRKVLVLNQDYRFSTKTTITLTKAWGPADGYDTIEVRRYTSATDRLVDFADGSILRAYDLNIAQVQTLHVAEEARDLTADTIGVNNDGHLDARGRRIVNVGDAVGDYDAINLHMMKTWNTSALNSANAAAASQAAAKTSENNSKTSENNAKTSENNSKTSENNAYQWAQRAEDSPVQGSEFSSYHYSRKAAKSAAAASTSEGNAKVSENNSKTSENNSKTSETAAAASAQTAKDEAAKLTNMNDFAAAIDSVASNKDVTMKAGFTARGIKSVGPVTADFGSGDWLTIGNGYSIGSDYQGNGVRIRNRSSQNVDIYSFESVGEYHSMSVHVYGNSSVSNAFYEFRNNGWLVSPNVQSTGQMNSIGDFRCNTTIYCGGGNTRLEQDGNIWGTRWNGSGEWLYDWIVRSFIQDVWLGGSEWMATPLGDNTRKDWQLFGGHVQTGFTQTDQGSYHIWTDGIFHRAIWVKTYNGASRVIASI